MGAPGVQKQSKGKKRTNRRKQSKKNGKEEEINIEQHESNLQRNLKNLAEKTQIKTWAKKQRKRITSRHIEVQKRLASHTIPTDENINHWEVSKQTINNINWY